MQEVPTAWITANANQELLDECFAEVTMHFEDPDAYSGATVSAWNLDTLTNRASVINDKNVSRYGTFDQNLWILDGSVDWFPDTATDSGIIIASLADNDKKTSEVINITFVNTISNIPGITIVWSTAFSEFPVKATVSLYLGSDVVKEFSIDNNADVETYLETGDVTYNKLRIEFDTWCLPLHRPRVESIIAGQRVVFDKSALMSFGVYQSCDISSAELPSGRLSFSIDNSDGKFDAFYEEGYSKYLRERQKITARVGMMLPSGAYYISAGVFYLNDWNIPIGDISASFEARDPVYFMNSNYIKGSRMKSSLYSLASAVLSDAIRHGSRITSWEIDDDLKRYSTTGILPIATHAECLQYIANAGGCYMFVDRNGALVMKRGISYDALYEIRPFQMFERPEMSNGARIKNLDISMLNYSDISGDYSTIYDDDIYVNGTQTFTIQFDSPIVTGTASLSVTGASIVQNQFWTNCTVLKLTGNGTAHVTITAREIVTKSQKYTFHNDDVGEDVSAENPIVTTKSLVEQVRGGTVYKSILREEINIGSMRFDPRLDIMDGFSYSAKDNPISLKDIKSVCVTEYEYQFTGMFKGRIKMITGD